MADQKKLMNKVKLKAEADKLTIASMMYFVADAVVFSTRDLVSQQMLLQMAWLSGETLLMKELLSFTSGVDISRVLKKVDKDAMLFVLTDNVIVVVSASDPVGREPQIIRPQGRS
ncbi:MAG TPA: hypothetical protein VK445_07795 [Dissulfurispiraceae bacterium]|nr:hypothetical protein [Dissulfurispiraceae bacterium]